MNKSNPSRREDDKKPRKPRISKDAHSGPKKNERAGKPFKVRSTSDYSENNSAKPDGNFDKFKRTPAPTRNSEDRPNRRFSAKDDSFRNSEDRPNRRFNAKDGAPRNSEDRPNRRFNAKEEFEPKTKRTFNEDKPTDFKKSTKSANSFERRNASPVEKKGRIDNKEYKSRKPKTDDRNSDRISRTVGNTERRSIVKKELPKENNYDQKRAERAASIDSPTEIYERIEFSGWEEEAKQPREPRAPRAKRVKEDEDLTPAPIKKPRKLKSEVGELPYERKPLKKAIIPTTPKKKEKTFADDGLIRLNKYIANAGICSRRKADELIESGAVMVNDELVKELGYKVKDSDKITFQGKVLKRQKLTYILLNKPKDYITTLDDPMERRTVIELIKSTTNERVYPVGRLDRNTTGLLLMTNDGELADVLSHPRNKVKKLYEVELDKSLSPSDFDKIKKGVELEDGEAEVDELSYVEGKSKKHIGIGIHIGRNRIVRRIFESLGYTIVRLDRVIYAGLTKLDLSRGRCRFLTPEEIIHLKHLNKY
jgi:23S rRNA pseudouridine2605 synthase